jgi:nitroimidazol reductase NimA-like FMN-containing flavoprotein (pyridoxamine 5'-phosphate oxidase superfamily)
MGERSESNAGWQELTKAECFDLLAKHPLGRIAVVDDLGPVVFPVNYLECAATGQPVHSWPLPS